MIENSIDGFIEFVLKIRRNAEMTVKNTGSEQAKKIAIDAKIAYEHAVSFKGYLVLQSTLKTKKD